MLPSSRLPLAALLLAALPACAEPEPAVLTQIQDRIDAACEAGTESVPAQEIFRDEARICYSYDTRNERTLFVLPGRWVDYDKVRGDDLHGRTTFQLSRARIDTQNGAVLRFHDVDFQCRPTTDLVIIRDYEHQLQTQARCAWLLGTRAEVERQLRRTPAHAPSMTLD